VVVVVLLPVVLEVFPPPDVLLELEVPPPLPDVALVSELLVPLQPSAKAATPSRAVPCRQENRWFIGPPPFDRSILNVGQ